MSGAQNAVTLPKFVPVNDDGTMPITLNALPLSLTSRPTMFGSAASWFFQNVSLMTATGCAFSVRSSSSVNRRP